MKKLLVFAFILVMVLSISACGGGNTASVTDAPTVKEIEPYEAPDPKPVVAQEQKPTPKPEPVQEQKPSMTRSQEQAIRKANEYLAFMAFSKSGLVSQLEFEGFSNEDATFAVENITVDWNMQAAIKAEDYLDFMSFSRQGLIDQLIFEGFTLDEATYGVNSTGL